MKKYKSIITSAFLSLFMLITTSCNDFLDKAPDDQLTMEMIFSDKVRTEDWLAGVYSSIPSPMWGYFKDQGYNIMGDDITIPQDWSPYGWANVYAYTTGNWSPISAWNPYYWAELPKRIRAGLIFLEKVRVIPEIDLTEAYVNQMKNEVRFLIAYYYSLMIELYGSIPFTPGVIYTVDAPESELMTSQVPYNQIVDCRQFIPVMQIGVKRLLSWLWLSGQKHYSTQQVLYSMEILISRIGRTQRESIYLMQKKNRKNGQKRQLLIWI
jgi:hypothetical protein